MNSQLFDPMDPKSIIGFLHTFKMAYDSNGVHKGAAMKLVPFFMNITAAIVLPARLSLMGVSSHCRVKEGMITSYVQIVKYF